MESWSGDSFGAPLIILNIFYFIFMGLIVN